jgi:hypothetical protein
MSPSGLFSTRTVLAFTAVAEIATGLALLIDPRLVIALLLGTGLSPDGMPVARVAGIALCGLGLACWPEGKPAAGRSPAVRGMLAYNVLVTLFLGGLFFFQNIGGVMLWPAVVLHAVVAILLAGAWRGGKTKWAAPL